MAYKKVSVEKRGKTGLIDKKCSTCKYIRYVDQLINKKIVTKERCRAWIIKDITLNVL